VLDITKYRPHRDIGDTNVWHIFFRRCAAIAVIIGGLKMDIACSTAFPVKNGVAGRSRIAIDDEAVPNRRDIDHVFLLEYALDRVSVSGSGGSIIFDRSGVLVKADARASHTLARMNVAVESDLQIEGLVSADAAQLPGWLRPEWLRPVYSGSDRIGTVVILPARFGSASTRTSAVRCGWRIWPRRLP
jgi:hypothetical protein